MKHACSHCHLEFDEKALIQEEQDGKTLYFCCNGCQGVYHLLRDSGLETFYDKLGTTKLEPPKEHQESVERFDSPVILEQYASPKEGGLLEISLVIEGIHCAACVWLNEKVLHKQPGVIEATINYTNSKAKILWNPAVIKLSQIVEIIRSIGYDAKPYDPRAQEQKANTLRRDYYTRMVVGIFCTMNIMWIAIAQYGGYFMGIRPDMKSILNVAEWILATPALFYSGWVFFKGAWAGLKHRMVNMDLLVATGSLLTYLYSIYATITLRGETYFESVTMIITFILIGKFLEARSKKGAVDILDRLNTQIPASATVIRNGERIEMKPEEIIIGDVIELKAGEKAPVDGELTSEQGQFDESSLTGESEPVEKLSGMSVISGAVNLAGIAIYTATKDLKTSTLYTLMNMVEESITKRPKIEQRTNRLSQYFSIVILVLAFGTFAGWLMAGSGFEEAFIISVSVIIIACPCALALATPVATLVGISGALEKGVVFKEARHIETMAQADTLVLDKTGTITVGRPEVTDASSIDSNVASRLLSLVSRSSHPVSQGVVRYLAKHFPETPISDLETFSQLNARGIEGRVDGRDVIGGNRMFLQECGVEVEPCGEGMEFYYAEEGKQVACFTLSDQPKEKAREVMSDLLQYRLDIWMLTGDHEKSARRMAEQVGIVQYESELFPDQKHEKVENFKKQGKIVVMAGDGINDAPALAESDIAIAMGGGTDLAIATSDVVVMDDSLISLQDSFEIAHRTYRNIKQNLALSLIYNAITVPLAMAGYVIPLVAAISMSLSSLLVVGNSLRIRANQTK